MGVQGYSVAQFTAFYEITRFLSQPLGSTGILAAGRGYSQRRRLGRVLKLA